MKERAFTLIEVVIIAAVIAIMASLILPIACSRGEAPPPERSGVRRVDAQVKTDSEGLTVEQRNIRQRLALDNELGSVKHLYVISAFSGDVLLYSTVRGKVTSSGKRLTPNTVHTGTPTGASGLIAEYGLTVHVNGQKMWTGEVLQDDGTYGSSVDYLYWWDEQGRYHQHYVSGGQILHISDQPIRTGPVVLNLSATE